MVPEKNPSDHCIDYAWWDFAMALDKILFLFCSFTRTVRVSLFIFAPVIFVMQLNKLNYLVKNPEVIMKMLFTCTQRHFRMVFMKQLHRFNRITLVGSILSKVAHHK